MRRLMVIDDIMCHKKREPADNANTVPGTNGLGHAVNGHEASGICILFGRAHAKENSFSLMQPCQMRSRT